MPVASSCCRGPMLPAKPSKLPGASHGMTQRRARTRRSRKAAAALRAAAWAAASPSAAAASSAAAAFSASASLNGASRNAPNLRLRQPPRSLAALALAVIPRGAHDRHRGVHGLRRSRQDRVRPRQLQPPFRR